MRLKRTRRAAAVLPLGAIAAAVFAGGSPASEPARTAQAEQAGVRGKFSLIQMIHTTNSSFGNLQGVNPWGGERVNRAAYAYRGIPCTGNAPVNNIASDLPSYGTRIAGSRAPSSMRAHPFTFRTVKRGNEWRLIGSIRFTVCKLTPGPTPIDDPVPDTDKPQIHVGFNAKFERHTGELVRWTGRFRIEGGTQRYEDLEGSGEIAGYFFCFNPAGCPATGAKYLDGQFNMSGRYADRTPDLATP